MKKPLFSTAALCLILQVTSFGQSIKLNNQNDPGSAMLEVSSSSKGVLIPNVALTGITDASTIALPTASLLVYNTASVSDVIPGYYYNSGTANSPVWSRLSTGTGTGGDGSETKVSAGTNVTVTGSGTSASPYEVNATEVDGDVTNEIQDLSLNGNILKITLKGSATEIDLSPYLDNTDNQTLAEILTSNTSAGSNKITSLADPTDAQDAATKAYVDGEISNLPTITTYAIGDFAHGGIVFWVDEIGQHGLVCAKSNQSSGIKWYAGTYGNTRARGDGLYAGKANTSIIISSQVAIGDDGSPYAAQLCNDLQITEGGRTFGDWYLPSKYELNLMYQNRATINVTALANGGSGFSRDYWSSTEFANFLAWRQYFSDGNQILNDKNDDYSVRAVSAF